MQTMAAAMTAAAPAKSEVGVTCSPSCVVPTAPLHQVRRPAIIRAAYATAPAMPIALPIAANTNPSVRNSRRTARAEYPTARSRPTSRARCSTPSLKNSAASSSADSTRKKLKYVKYSPKSVAPRDARSPSARTSTTEKPVASGSSAARRPIVNRLRASINDSPGAGAIRIEVRSP